MIYVKVKKTEENKNLFKFGCKGYGWCYFEDLENKLVTIQCQDNYKGARGFTVDRADIEVCDMQVPNPYEK